MKKNAIILLSLIILLLYSCKKEATSLSAKLTNSFTITSDITNINDSISIVLNQLRLNKTIRIDSIISKDGFFKITIPSDTTPQKYEILLKGYPSKKNIYYLNIWSEGENINISGTYDGKRIQNLDIKGCDLNYIEKKYLDIILKYDKIYSKELESPITPEAKNALFQKYVNLIHSDQIKFIFENPNNFVSLTYIFMHSSKVSQDSLNLYYNRLDKKLQNSEKGKALKEISSAKKLEVGDHVLDFKAQDINGKKVYLSDFLGQIVLLDFWASWCAPCKEQNKKEFPYLNKKFREKGLAIISYSLDKKSEKQAWIKESKKNTWINISNLKGFSDPVAVQYHIYSIPNSFLINREGIIVKSFNGYDEKNNKIEREIEKLLE